MKMLQKTLLALAAGSLLTVGAQAAVSYGNGYTGQPYVGAKVGKFDLGESGAKDPTAYGVVAGYNFDPNFGIEAEYVGSDDANYYNGDVDAKTYGAYGTYRYGFPNTGLYAKGKLGIAETKVKGSSVLPNASIDSSKTSLAGGVGLGYNVNPNFGIEAEYDRLSSDANLMTIGANLKF